MMAEPSECPSCIPGVRSLGDLSQHAPSPESEEGTGFQILRMRHSRASVNLSTAMTDGEGDFQQVQEQEPVPDVHARCVRFLLL
jgi:hypothetical protein